MQLGRQITDTPEEAVVEIEKASDFIHNVSVALWTFLFSGMIMAYWVLGSKRWCAKSLCSIGYFHVGCGPAILVAVMLAYPESGWTLLFVVVCGAVGAPNGYLMYLVAQKEAVFLCRLCGGELRVVSSAHLCVDLV